MIELLRMYHAQGKTLGELSGRRYFNRKPKTLLQYAKAASLAFPDHVEVEMATEGSKAKKARERKEKSS